MTFPQESDYSRRGKALESKNSPCCKQYLQELHLDPHCECDFCFSRQSLSFPRQCWPVKGARGQDQIRPTGICDRQCCYFWVSKIQAYHYLWFQLRGPQDPHSNYLEINLARPVSCHSSIFSQEFLQNELQNLILWAPFSQASTRGWNLRISSVVSQDSLKVEGLFVLHWKALSIIYELVFLLMELKSPSCFGSKELLAASKLIVRIEFCLRSYGFVDFK